MTPDRPLPRGLFALFATASLVISGCGTEGTSPQSSSTPTESRPPVVEELDPKVARRQALIRSDAVKVAGPDEVHSAGKPTPLVFHITVPAATATDRIQADLSGDCDASIHGARAGLDNIIVPVTRGGADIAVTASVPPGIDRCDVTIDALAPKRPDTGKGHTATLLR